MRPILIGLLASSFLFGGIDPIGLAWQQAEAQQSTVDDDASFQRLAERYERILRRNPRPGTAFDLWYRLYLDAGKLHELSERVQLWVEAEAEDGGTWLIQGLVEQRAGRLPEAAAALAEAESRRRDDPTPPRVLAAVLAQQGRFEHAVEAMERALSRDPPAVDLMPIYKQLGQWQLRLGRRDAALVTWNRLADQFADDRGVLEELAELLGEEQLWDESITRWLQVGQLTSDDPAARLRVDLAIAQLYVQRGQTQSAVNLLGEALDRVEPDSWQARDIRDRLQRIFLRSNDTAGWLAFWQQRQAARRDDLSCRLELARVLAALDRVDESLQQLREALAVAPSRQDVGLALINQLRGLGLWPQAIEQARELVKRSPSDLDGWDLLAQLLLNETPQLKPTEAVKQAIECWQRMAEARPQDPALALRAAEACRQAASVAASSAALAPATPNTATPNPAATDNPSPAKPSESLTGEISSENSGERQLLSAAERFYREAHRRAAGQAPYDEYLGEFLHGQGRRQEALAIWRQPLEALGAAADADAWRRLSELLARHGYAPEATAAGERALQLAPNRFALLLHQAQLLLQTGQAQAAIDRLPAVIDAAEDDGQRQQALQVYVEASLATGQVEQQIHDLQQLLRQSRGTVIQYRLLAQLLAQRWRWREAGDALAAALRIADDDPALLKQYAEALERQDLLDLAADQYRRLMELDRRNRSLHGQALVKLELRRNDPQAARRLAEQLVVWSPTSFELLELLAEVAFRQNDEPAALNALRKMVRLSPDDLARRQQLADVLAGRGQRAEALEHYWRCFEQAGTFEQKRAIVFALAERTAEPAELDAIVEQLRSARFRGDDPSLARLCAVAVLRRAERYETAERILRDMLAQRPNDLDALRELADMARQRQQYDEALSVQQRLVQLDGRPSQLELLAADFGRAGQREKAVEVWQRILRQSNDEEAVARAVDQQFAAGAVDEALALADWGCQHRPGSWALLYRSAYANFALGRLDEAEARFAALLALPVSLASRAELASQQLAPLPPLTSRLVPVPLEATAMQWSEPTCSELRELQQAAVAHARWTALRFNVGPAVVPRGAALTPAQQAQLKADRDRSRDARRQMRASVGMPSALATARVESLVARSLIASQQSRVASWEQQLIDQSGEDVDALRQLTLARAVDNQLYSSWDQLQELVERQPDDALPHLLRVTATVSASPETWRNVATQRLRITTDLRTSYQWLKQRLPGLARQCRDHVGQQLILLEDVTAARQLVLSELTEAGPLSEVADLAYLGFQLEDASVRRRILTKAVAAERDAVETTHASNLEWLVTLALVTNSSVALSEGEVDAVLTLFDRLLRSPTGPALAGPALAGPALAGPAPPVVSASRARRLQQLQHIAVRQQRNASLSRAARMQPLGPGGSVSTTTSSAVPVWRLGPANPPNPGGYGSQNFPATTRWLDAGLGQLLWQLHAVVSEAKRGDQLQRLLKQGQQLPDVELAARYRLAEVCLLWWSGEQRASAERMRELCGQFPDDSELRLLLANGYFILKDFRESLQQLDAIKAASPAVASVAKELRGQIQSRWSGEALLHVLTGHSGVVRSIAFAPDGSRLASGSVDRTVGLWDARNGLRTRTIESHQDIVLCVVFSPDGRLLASTGYDRVIRLWDTVAEKEVGLLPAGETPVRCLAFAPDGKTLASASDDGVIQLWDVAERQRQATLVGHREAVLALAFSRDGARLASGGTDATVLLWDVAERKVARRLAGHQERVSAVVFSPDDATLYTASWDGAVLAWSARTGERLAAHEKSAQEGSSEEKSAEEIRGMAVSPDGKLLAWGGGDRTLKIVRLSDWREVAQLRGHSGAVQAVAFSADGSLVASASYDGNVHVWQVP